MELKKHPETEEEYWASIEALGGYLWSTRHHISHGRIENTPEVEKDLDETAKLSMQLAIELSRFGVILPKDCPKVGIGEEKPKAPEGKIWYWDWYEKMKEKSYTAKYDKLICSACSLSKGVDKFIFLGEVPCSAFSGSIYRLRSPFICAMMSSPSYSWSRKKLLAQIKKAGGTEAVAKFKAKEAELKAAAEKG